MSSLFSLQYGANCVSRDIIHCYRIIDKRSWIPYTYNWHATYMLSSSKSIYN